MWCMGGAPGVPTHSSKERTSVPHASQLAQLTTANMLRGISSFARGGEDTTGGGMLPAPRTPVCRSSRTFAGTSQPGLLPTHATLTFPCQHLPAVAIFTGTGSAGTAGCSWHPRRPIPPRPLLLSDPLPSGQRVLRGLLCLRLSLPP